ncbi:alanine aminotransferase [Schizosaccharomyces japonicus yFS275]|uniref:Glutamate pyruvate transaminase n=1 Tax=Schizosaccharomyces japonicus (strain yFS275 / FY16936) TaxID=402676 RepID=B6K616_SCHJY|nr:alanine aminotransferase [Schizosaccharomyces japonicus yFS275]EEB08970.1 alanine aminotransferase [Schizosaccharomyces japonicus yFS275]
MTVVYKLNVFKDPEQLNQNVFAAQYAVRGPLAVRAEELRAQLKEKPDSLPFTEIINANIGNPHQMGQIPLTFIRQVLALCQYPALIENAEITQKLFPSDAIARAKELLEETGGIGAYSSSQGVPLVRRDVARFIEERDGFPSDPNHIFLTTGATQAVRMMINLLIARPYHGILLPIPQYPLYTASMALYGGRTVPYYLNEETNWSVSVEELQRAYDAGTAEGTEIRAVVFINPGNPTGSCLNEKAIEDILGFAKRNGVIVIADEVYQANVYDLPFVSFKKVLSRLQTENPNDAWDKVSLISIHSVSKGQLGECGQRGGYMEVTNIPEAAFKQIYKLASIDVCPPVAGQFIVDILVRPPKLGDPSHDLYHKQIKDVHEQLFKQCRQLHSALSSMKYVKCQEPRGAMYLHPRIFFPKKLIETAKAQGAEPDELYCMELLESTGICILPGSGFGQKENEFHIRTTFLAQGEEYLKHYVAGHNKIMEKYE